MTAPTPPSGVPEPVLVFAYGSNLLPARLQARTPSARVRSVAWLPGHRLAFDKRGADGSGKCHVVPAPGERVFGVVYSIDGPGELAVLDRIEGVGIGYRRVAVTVHCEPAQGGAAGRAAVPATCRAELYMALPEAIGEPLVPFDWYRELVLAGARHHGLPTAHCEAIAAVSCVTDPDGRRRALALSILTGPADLAVGVEASTRPSPATTLSPTATATATAIPTPVPPVSTPVRARAGGPASAPGE